MLQENITTDFDCSQYINDKLMRCTIKICTYGNDYFS